jgi:peptide/nickel transport system substrate-binding protein
MGAMGAVRKWAGIACAASVLSLSAAALTTGAAAAATKVSGGTVTWAEPPGSTPNYIFPFDPTATSGVNNAAYLQQMSWRTLNWAGTGETAITIDQGRTMYKSVAYSNGSKTVTITMKPWRWSDGQPVTSRDVEFSINLYKYNKAQWSQYSPGDIPDNIASMTLPNSHTIVLNLTKAYSDTWFTDNQLGVITPMPQHSWDKTSDSGAIGDYDTTATGATAVYNYLNTAAMNTSTYGTNPLWKVVDGPWILQSLTSTGQATFIRNTAYSGPVTGSITKFVEVPFTTDTAELNVLRSGSSLDIGYLPHADLGQKGALQSDGYSLAPWINLGVDYAVYNFKNPQVGPMLSQLYIRQAIQHTENQPQILSDIFKGYGFPTYGPVPLLPKNPYVDTFEKTNPYPFSIAAAKSLLTSHGWTIHAGGTDVCSKPGTGTGECGAGITQGEKLAFELLYSNGDQDVVRMNEVIASSAAQAGITLNLKSQPFNDVISVVQPCATSCNWQIGEYGGISYSTLPTGDGLFATGASLNSGDYSNPTDDANINGTLFSNSASAFSKYEDFVAKDLPWMWQVTPDYALTEVKSNLHGVVPQNGYILITPEDYYFTK